MLFECKAEIKTRKKVLKSQSKESRNSIETFIFDEHCLFYNTIAMILFLTFANESNPPFQFLQGYASDDTK